MQTFADEYGLHADNCTIRTVRRGETLDPKTSPEAIALEKVEGRIALATSSQTIFVGTSVDRSTVFWRVPTNDEHGYERTGMSEARRLGGAILWHSDEGDLVISPSKPEGPHQENVKLHTFRPIEAPRDEHGAYRGDKFEGTVAALGDVGLIVDAGHFDYMFIDRDEIDQRDLQELVVGQPVEMEFRAGLVKVERRAELTRAREANRETGGLGL